MNTFETDAAFVAHTYARFPVEIVGGKGSVLTGSDGKSYIDLGSGIAVNTLGACDAGWIKAVTDQLHRFGHTSNLYYSAPCANLAAELCARTGMQKVFFSNSGAEANECAVKAARAYGAAKHGADCYTILTLKNSFHGRTLTTLAATGQDVFHEKFQPLTPGFISIEPTPAALAAALDTYRVAGVLFEIVRGEGGVLPLDKVFVDALVKEAAAHDFLLMCDEVQCGNGRSGTLYAYMQYGLSPDVVTTAKGLCGGLPLGATLLGDKVADLFTPGSNGSTFGGNPIAAAGALYVLSQIDDDLLAGVRRKSAMICEALTGAPGVGSVTGLGLMLGVQTALPAKEVASRCIGRGVLVLTAKDKVRLLPALNIPDDLLMQALGILKDICAEGVQ